MRVRVQGRKGYEGEGEGDGGWFLEGWLKKEEGERKESKRKKDRGGRG